MPFSSRFLDGDAAATAFLPDGFRRSADRAAAVRTAAARPVASALVAALAHQAAPSGLRAAQRRSLDALAAGGAAAVLVGQQVGLHLGPLYTVHKAAAAVATARALAAETGAPVVPVFWLQTEDHDLDEIRSVTIPTADGPLDLVVPDDGRDRVAVRHRRLPDAVAAVGDALEIALDGAPYAAEATDWARRHWAPGRLWHEAFAGALTELFGDDGLLLVDPRDPAVAALSAPVLARALEDADDLASALRERAAALTAAGFAVQVHVRERAPLVFFHPDGPEGPRYRLEPAGAADWLLVGADRRVSRQEVRARAAAEPRVLSTSALLRPIVQDTLFPTAMILGGPGEIAYFAELPPLYQRFDRPMPLIGPRAHTRIVDGKARRLLGQLGLAPAATARPRAELLAGMALRSAADLPVPDAARRELADEAAALVERFGARVGALGPGLDDALEKTRRTLAHAVGKLADRYERALAQRDEITASRVDRLLALLQPDGVPQERRYGVAAWGAHHGLRALAARIVADCVPFDATLRDLELEGGHG